MKDPVENRRRAIAKQWHPDAHPTASPQEKERLGKRFAEEMARLEAEVLRRKREQERSREARTADVAKAAKAAKAAEAARAATAARAAAAQRAAEAAKAAREAEAAQAAEAERARAAARANDPADKAVEGPPWIVGTALATTVVAAVLGWAISGQFIGSLAAGAPMFFVLQWVVGGIGENTASSGLSRAERARRAVEARAARLPYFFADLPRVDRIKMRLRYAATGVAAFAVLMGALWWYVSGAHDDRFRNAIHTNAKVVNVRSEESWRRRGGKTTVWINTIEFDGQKGELFGPGHYVGESVRVRYLPGLTYEHYSGNVERVWN